ncbi:hypothetical protein MKW98_019245 [Papaver atlanticum]|uniref:Knottins-like domain-containing protein n=1 Tax=Papaver atlanticum TaxID=357466 RepID=A0AAD4XU63_9MAGN|nr:hypothetical protein MKW98_019245 [Papaver atlanticum]
MKSGISTKSVICSVFFFMLLLLTFQEGMVMRVDGARTNRMCDSKSHKFRGPCVSDTNCRNVCQTERFSDGNCRGVRRRCYCQNPCI